MSLLAVVLPIIWRRKRSAAALVFLGLFWLYLMLLVGATIFPLPIPLDWGGTTPRQPIGIILERINLIPFRYSHIFDLSLNIFYFELVGNVLLTIPFGFGLNFITRIRARHALWLAFAVGLSIELSQLLVSLLIGIGYRGVDITDVLLNAAGFLVGFACFSVFAWIFRAFIRLFRIEPRGIWGYVNDIVYPPKPK